MKYLSTILISFLFVFSSCKSRKIAASTQEIEALNNMIIARSFEIRSDWAYPQTSNAMQQVLNSGIMGPGNNAGAISLIGNTNFLKIKGDSVQSYLPYFGERQMNVDYGGRDSAIELKGLMENYKVEINKDESRDIYFEANSNRENHYIYIKLYPNKTSSIVINSTSRFPIRYTGSVLELEMEQ